MQEYYMLFGIFAKDVRFIFLLISNTRMFVYFVYCIFTIVYLWQGGVMKQPLIKHRPRLSMT